MNFAGVAAYDAASDFHEGLVDESEALESNAKAAKVFCLARYHEADRAERFRLWSAAQSRKQHLMQPLLDAGGLPVTQTRQQLMPLPQPISRGSGSQRRPVCKTKRMPVSTARLSSGLRPG
jgi:hypothetical protein